MTRIEAKFNSLTRGGRKGFIRYISVYEIEKQLTTLRNERIAMEFTGDGETGEAYLIGAIAKTLNVTNRSKVQ